MRIFTLISEARISYHYLLLVILFFFSTISCADTLTDSLNKDSQQYLSFYETVDGERIHWEANFFGDEITSIYKNGKRIPDDLADDYKYKIYNELDEMRFGSTHFSLRMPAIIGDEFHLDMEELHKELEEMKKELPKHKDHLRFYQFDSEEFKKEMEDLKKELEESKLEIYQWRFDEEEFKEQMEELEKNLKENLPKLKKFHFEWEEEDTEA